MWYWQKRDTDQWNRVKTQKKNPSQICDNTTQLRNTNLFKKCYWENWITTCKRMKLDPYLAHKTNIRTETIKFPEENTGENSLTLFLAMIFFF